MALTPLRKPAKAEAKVDPSIEQPIKAVEPAKPITNRCTAHRRNGEQCRKSAVHGSNVCATHGGSAPQVKRKAQVRILMSMDLAAAKVVALMQDKKVPYATQLAAARELLDRGGLAATQMVEVTGTVSHIDETAQLVFIDRTMDYDDEDVIDAVVVEDYKPLDATLDVSQRPGAQDEQQRALPARTPTAPGARGPVQQPRQEPTPTTTPLSHSEGYFERSERLHQESYERESDRNRPDPNAARSSTASFGRPKRRNQS